MPAIRRQQTNRIPQGMPRAETRKKRNARRKARGKKGRWLSRV